MSQSVAPSTAPTLHSALTIAPIAGTGALPELHTAEPPPKSQPRVRLEVDARRALLLEVGRELFATRGYDELSIDEIAHAAGISKGLLYHYFPSKRAFYVESLRDAAEELLRHTIPPRSLAPIDRLRAGIDAFLAYVDSHRTMFSTLIWRGIPRDPELTCIVENTRHRFFELLLTELAQSPIGRNALRGFIGFIEASMLDWIERRDITQRDLSALLVAVFREIVVQPASARSA